jgi:conjugative transposon TraN protein
MKKHTMLLLLCLIGLYTMATAQPTVQPQLQLSHLRTTSLVFPFSIKSVDRGSAAILARVAPETRNILFVKAASKGFPETNLTVITSDGKLYCFPVSYASQPSVTVVQVPEGSEARAPVRLTGASLNEAQLQVICHQLETASRFYYGIRDRDGGMKAVLEGIYTYREMLFLRVVLGNSSPLPFQPGPVRVSLRDRKQLRRTATQETEVPPAYVYGLERPVVASGDGKVFLIVLESPRLTGQKKLVLDIYQQQGDLHLELFLHPRHLAKALPLHLDKIF